MIEGASNAVRDVRQVADQGSGTDADPDRRIQGGAGGAKVRKGGWSDRIAANAAVQSDVRAKAASSGREVERGTDDLGLDLTEAMRAALATVAKAPPRAASPDGVRDSGGVRGLGDILARCKVNDETGCWEWTGAMSYPRGYPTPNVHLGAGALGSGTKSNTISAARAAWLLAGRPLKRGHVVWRHICMADQHGLCVNPAHARSGTRQQMCAAMVASGHNRGSDLRRLVNAKNRAPMIKPAEVVRKAEAMFDSGATTKAVCEALKLTGETARAIRLRQHPHSTGRVNVLPGASVFHMRAVQR